MANKHPMQGTQSELQQAVDDAAKRAQQRGADQTARVNQPGSTQVNPFSGTPKKAGQ